MFEEGGSLLAKSVIALIPKIDPSLYDTEPLKIICVGSVWLSWEHIKNGLISTLEDHKVNFDIEFLRLTTTTALGAVYLAADHINFDFVKDFKKNYNVFHTYPGKSMFRWTENCNVIHFFSQMYF